jgi:hypothetical protein
VLLVLHIPVAIVTVVWLLVLAAAHIEHM